MDFNVRKSVVNGLSVLYFVVIVLYSICVYLDYQQLDFSFGFARIPILMVLYFFASHERSYIYFLALFFFQIAAFLFNINSDIYLIYAVIISVIFRFLILILVYRAIDNVKWKIAVMTSLPFLFVYLYLINLMKEAVGDSYFPWILNVFLTASLGGLAVTNFIYKDDRKSFWLLISVMLFIIQIGLFLINVYYLKQQVFLQLIILFYGVSHFTFYKFMIVKETAELN